MDLPDDPGTFTSSGWQDSPFCQIWTSVATDLFRSPSGGTGGRGVHARAEPRAAFAGDEGAREGVPAELLHRGAAEPERAGHGAQASPPR